MNEVSRKISFVREILRKNNLAAAHLRGVDWFSWITGGGSSVVILTSEIGIAEILITETEAFVLTNRIESARLASEEVPKEFEVTSFDWQDARSIEKFVNEKARGKALCSDRATANEKPLPVELLIYKMKMQPEELQRYREVGQKAAEAMTEAILKAQPDWTENQLAGAGAEALWSRGLDPTLILVAGNKRGSQYRHPISKNESLGESAMMVFCARGFGLYANLTRFIFFRDLVSQEKKSFEALSNIESRTFLKTKVGSSLSEVYTELSNAYSAEGFKNEINLHHQGGPTGYLSRELVARPQVSGEAALASDLKIESGMAFAWNPSLPGAKIEDTVLVQDSGLEILTQDHKWPTQVISGLKRPQVWIQK